MTSHMSRRTIAKSIRSSTIAIDQREDIITVRLDLWEIMKHNEVRNQTIGILVYQ